MNINQRIINLLMFTKCVTHLIILVRLGHRPVDWQQQWQLAFGTDSRRPIWRQTGGLSHGRSCDPALTIFTDPLPWHFSQLSCTWRIDPCNGPSLTQYRTSKPTNNDITWFSEPYIIIILLWILSLNGSRLTTCENKTLGLVAWAELLCSMNSVPRSYLR